MISKKKKRFIVLAILALLISAFFLSLSLLSRTGKRNWENAEQVSVGITVDSMLLIMGEPEVILTDVWYLQREEIKEIYLYENVFLASDWINVSIDTSGRVLEVYSNP